MVSYSSAGNKISLNDNILAFFFFFTSSILAAVLRFLGVKKHPSFYSSITAGPLSLISKMQAYIPSGIFQSDREPCEDCLSQCSLLLIK